MSTIHSMNKMITDHLDYVYFLLESVNDSYFTINGIENILTECENLFTDCSISSIESFVENLKKFMSKNEEMKNDKLFKWTVETVIYQIDVNVRYCINKKIDIQS